MKAVLLSIYSCLSIVSIVFLGSCSEKKTFEINTSNINVDIEIKRLEQDLFTMNLDSLSKNIPLLVEKYGEFLDLFSHRIIQIGDPKDEYFPVVLTRFITDYNNNIIITKCNEVFSSIEDVEENLEEAFRHYKYYFPQFEVPQVATYISGFNESVVISQEYIGIGLDKYLGSNWDVYQRVFPEKRYLIRNFSKEKIPADVMQLVAESEFEFNDSISDLLSYMIYQGRNKYFIKVMIPEISDTVVYGFLKQELEFCNNNEAKMWETIIQEKLLFSTDKVVIRKCINDAPFTYYFTKESPGKSVVWIGEQIVAKYMDQNRDITIPELMAIRDYRSILSGAKYDPK